MKYDKNRGDTNGEKCNKTEIQMEKNAIKVGGGGWEWEFEIESEEIEEWMGYIMVMLGLKLIVKFRAFGP